MKKRRVDDEDFRKTENESRFKRFNDDYEGSDFRAKHNENQLASITKGLKDPDNRAEQNARNLISMAKILENPEKRAEQNEHSLVSMTKRLENSEKRAEQSVRNLVSMTKRMKNFAKRAEHNRYVLQKYKSYKGNFIFVTIDYFLQISVDPTYVCSCCGCLHFWKSVVILTRARLDSMGDQTIIDQGCYLSL